MNICLARRENKALISKRVICSGNVHNDVLRLHLIGVKKILMQKQSTSRQFKSAMERLFYTLIRSRFRQNIQAVHLTAKERSSTVFLFAELVLLF